MQSEEVALVMHVLHSRQGWSITEIAREFGVDWRTAKRHATSPEPQSYGPRAKPSQLSPAQLAHVQRRLDDFAAIRATILFRELQGLGYEGSYPSLVRRVRELRGVLRTPDEVIRFETDPGHQLQVDWADCGRWICGDRLADLYALVAVLGFSRMVAFRFSTDKTRPTTLRLLVELLHALGGVPGEVLTDRDPAFCIGSLSDGRAVLAPEWIDLSRTLGLDARACKPRRPQTKGKVERVVREVKEDFLVWLTGQVLPMQPTTGDYDAFAARWAREVVEPRRHRTTGRIVGEAWAEERGLLRPIPPRILHATTQDARCLDPQVVAPAPLRACQRPVLDPMADRRALAGGRIVEERVLADYEVISR